MVKRVIHRPLLVQYGNDLTAMLMRECGAGHLAYFSKTDRALYVDPAHRSRVREFLKASISGTHWSFNVKEQKEEGNEEEYHLWDPKKDPKKGDVRVFDLECVNVTITVNCGPVVGGTKAKYAMANPFDIGECNGPRERLCWEVFGKIGEYDAFADPHCTEKIGKGELVGWSCLQL